MSEIFTIEGLLQDEKLTAGRRYAMEGVAAYYLAKMGVVGSELEHRSPSTQFLHYLNDFKIDDPLIEDIAKQRMMYAAGGFTDPGDEHIRQELIQKAEQYPQSEV